MPKGDVTGGTSMSRTCGRLRPRRSTSGSELFTTRTVLPTRRMIRPKWNMVLGAWSKLWSPGTPKFQRLRNDKPSEWSYRTLRSVIKHCPRGADRWGMSEIKLLPDQAVRDLVLFLKCVEVMASWPPALREMLYLQLPKEGAKNAGERRPIALLPQWRQLCKDRGETPVGQSALDETFARVFLDCSKCYERVPLSMLEQLAIESGCPLCALNVALNMYSGQRRMLVQGAVSEGVTATCGLPPGCGHAVDMLHAFLIKSLRCAGRQVEVRKYVDDMVLISSGPGFAGNLCYAYRQVLRSLMSVNMRVNALKTVVLCNGSVTKRSSGRSGERVSFRVFKSLLVIWELTLSGLRGGIIPCSYSQKLSSID
eukprot:5545376-Amphidinium_carterae.1